MLRGEALELSVFGLSFALVLGSGPEPTSFPA